MAKDRGKSAPEGISSVVKLRLKDKGQVIERDLAFFWSSLLRSSETIRATFTRDEFLFVSHLLAAHAPQAADALAWTSQKPNPVYCLLLAREDTLRIACRDILRQTNIFSALLRKTKALHPFDALTLADMAEQLWKDGPGRGHDALMLDFLFPS